MNLFSKVAETIGAVFHRKARIAMESEMPNLSGNATVSSIQSALRAAEGGETRELFGLYRDLTAGGSHIQAEFNKRKLAMLAQPKSVLPADKAKAEDVKAAAAVTQMIADCENWNDGITHLLDSCLWPVAVVEKIFRPVEPGEPAAVLGLKFTLKRLEIVNPTLLCFRKPYQSGWRAAGKMPASPSGVVTADAWEPDLRFWTTDEEGRILFDYERTYSADRVRHVVHRGHLLVGMRDCWGGPMRAIVFWWLLSVLARDWFGRGMERWGSPFPVGRTDAKNPAAVDMLREAFSLSTKVGGLVVDHETQVELKEIAASGMADAYEKFLNVCNREISKVIVGQTASAEAQSTGLGSSVGDLHSDVRQDIRMFDQMRMGDTLKSQLFRQCLAVNGIQANVPDIVWGGLSDEDAKALAEVLNILSTAGFEPTDEAIPTLSERLGFEIQRKAPPPTPLSFGEVRSSKFEVRSEEDEEDKGQKADPETEKLMVTLPPRVRGHLALLSQQGRMADALGVPATWLNPLRDFLEEIQVKASDKSLSEQDLMQFLDEAIKRVPELFKDMDLDELAKVMEAGMGESVLQEVRRQVRSSKSEVRSS
jgi:hypothetical protein